MERRQWTEADFEELSWHDNHVHSLEIRDGAHGAGELILGLGFIVGWHPPEDDRFTFSIAPARLHFREVTGLRIEIDYAGPSASLTPFSLDAILRTAHRHTPEMGTHHYALAINWPRGAITFTSAGFTQTLLGPATRTSEQWLTSEQRQRTFEDGATGGA